MQCRMDRSCARKHGLVGPEITADKIIAQTAGNDIYGDMKSGVQRQRDKMPAGDRVPMQAVVNDQHPLHTIQEEQKRHRQKADLAGLMDDLFVAGDGM